MILLVSHAKTYQTSSSIQEQLRPTISSLSSKASSCSIMASVFMVILDPRTISLDSAIDNLINTHGDPQKVATWRAQSIDHLFADFHAAVYELDRQKEQRRKLLEAIQTDRHGDNLCPLHNHPLNGLRLKQEAQITHCVSLRLSVRRLGIPSVPTLADAMWYGPLEREEIIGAFVILESALASIISEKEALSSRWWKRDGSWDEEKGNIREIRETLARLQF